MPRPAQVSEYRDLWHPSRAVFRKMKDPRRATRGEQARRLNSRGLFWRQGQIGEFEWDGH
jgi:hypothetical protein